ncbi:hypothetical protein IV487_13080 [Enterococcus saccharolyticus]|uniref:DNA-directed RNA polymerase beta subunit n=1 Tax=Candidatus Enterococcus willemsii TaxID=1857215 RepID=A0ABQ6Z044_9ENTE|nr:MULTISPECIES: hypothetical protein [Enterococcus]KAF1304266.1 hypothetical protein BAU17_12680 [Enterococcus sp. CU12B]MCD5003396.1 hypothetical protein [Enterococcus saccharolyticus]
MSSLHPYNDRKKIKWAGFYLSEHTAQIDAQKRGSSIEPKPQMSEEEITRTLEKAVLYNQSIAIQLNQIADEQYLPDIEGYLQGYENNVLFVANQQIELEMIRHITLSTPRKWSNLD